MARWRRAPGVLAPLVLALAVAGCADEPATSKPAASPERAAAPERVAIPEWGLSVELAARWRLATESLTPALTDPREVLAAGNYPLAYRESECGHMPVSALEDMPPDGAFVTLMERGTNDRATWADFPARPAQFGPELGGPSEVSGCVRDARFSDHWFGFTDGGRHFHVLVAFGPRAPESVRQEAWSLLGSLRVDPSVKPDWQSVG